ncbi:MAG: hypothetical protein JXA38_05040, partial [Methanosarcinaceae archaeon]|nr:hypothetical protein [Methanosarcinaceae archaeon]
MEKTLETCRRLWNDLLSTRVKLFERYDLYPDSKMLEKQLKFIEYTMNIHSLVSLNVFERVKNAYFKFLDDIKNDRLKKLKPKKGTFVKREDILASNLIYSISNNLDSKPS